MDAIYPQLLDTSEAATTRLTDTELTATAATQQEGEGWQQLAKNLKHILISTEQQSMQTTPTMTL